MAHKSSIVSQKQILSHRESTLLSAHGSSSVLGQPVILQEAPGPRTGNQPPMADFTRASENWAGVPL